MDKSILKGFSLHPENETYLKSVIVKSRSKTLNLLISAFRERGLVINFNRSFANLESPTSAKIDFENLEYLLGNTVSSFSFTLNCLIATAKDNSVKP